jgi:hypothetical protein
MNNKHELMFNFRISGNIVQKIGQYPSLADLEQNVIKKYSKVLSKNDLRDLSKAVGLHAHGIGAGAFVYLRRVFEGMIEKSYTESIKEGTWNKAIDFKRIDMKEKIDNLEPYLPNFIYKNPIIYGILSAGIHSLEEDKERELRLSKGLNKLNSEISKINK